MTEELCYLAWTLITSIGSTQSTHKSCQLFTYTIQILIRIVIIRVQPTSAWRWFITWIEIWISVFTWIQSGLWSRLKVSCKQGSRRVVCLNYRQRRFSPAQKAGSYITVQRPAKQTSMQVPITQHLNDGTPSTNLDICTSNTSLHDLGNKIKDPKRVTLKLHEAKNIALKETHLFYKKSTSQTRHSHTHAIHSLVPRPSPSFLSLLVWVSRRGPGTFPRVSDVTDRAT